MTKDLQEKRWLVLRERVSFSRAKDRRDVTLELTSKIVRAPELMTSKGV